MVRFQHHNNTYTHTHTLAKAFATIIWINYRYYRNIITHDLSIYTVYILDVLHFYYNIPCALVNACTHNVAVWVCSFLLSSRELVSKTKMAKSR